MPNKVKYKDWSQKDKQKMIDYVTSFRKNVKERALAYLGGKCWQCGYCGPALDFHHLDPAQKDFAISAGGQTRSWKRVEREIQKCALLCANHHREVHAGLASCPSQPWRDPP